jgi:threonine dehydratase
MLGAGKWRRMTRLPASLLMQRAAASSSGASVASTGNGGEDFNRDHTDYLARILNARVYEIAIETPLQPAPCMSKAIHNNVLLKVREIVESLS